MKPLNTALFLLLLILTSSFYLQGHEGSEEDDALSRIISLAFIRNPTLEDLYARIKEGEGRATESSGEFDSIFGANSSYRIETTPTTLHDRLGGYPKTVWEHTTSGELFFAKKFRSGISLRPSVSIHRLEDNFENRSVPNRGSIALTLELPLLKGGGRLATTAEETALHLQYQALCLEWPQLVSEVIIEIAVVYWNYLSLYQQMGILEEAKKQAEQLVKETQILVDAQQQPESDLFQAKATVASRENRFLEIKQRWLRVRHNLVRLAGGDINSITIPFHPLSVPSSEDLLLFFSSTSVENSIARALSERGDFLGREKALLASKYLLARARNNLKPGLNLQLEVHNSGLREGEGGKHFWNSLHKRSHGAGGSAQLNYFIPICNDEARGMFQQQQGKLYIQNANLIELKNAIETEIKDAFTDLKEHHARQLALTSAAEEYRKTVEQEKERFTQGITTIIDVIQLDNRYLTALVEKEQQKFEYLQSILRLQLSLGNVLSPKKSSTEIDTASLIQLPSVPLGF